MTGRSAVERVEILNDGASAIYGSDAIAGVVNIILRTNHQGLEASGSVGWFEGKNDYRATLTGGWATCRRTSSTSSACSTTTSATCCC